MLLWITDALLFSCLGPSTSVLPWYFLFSVRFSHLFCTMKWGVSDTLYFTAADTRSSTGETWAWATENTMQPPGTDDVFVNCAVCQACLFHSIKMVYFKTMKRENLRYRIVTITLKCNKKIWASWEKCYYSFCQKLSAYQLSHFIPVISIVPVSTMVEQWIVSGTLHRSPHLLFRRT